jgi:hypothetical protein
VDPVVESVVAPSVEAADGVVEEATGPPLDLTRLGLGVDLGVTPRADGGSAIRVELSASGNRSDSGQQPASGGGGRAASETASTGTSSSGSSGNEGGTTASPTLTSAVTSTVTGTVSSTLSTVGGLLR